MAEEQAPTEQSHAQRLNENNTKRKRPCEAQPEDEDSTQPSPKRPLRHTECGLSMKEKNKEEAQQCLRPERDDGGQKKSRKRANRHISEQALRNMMQRALDTGSLAGLHPTARLVDDSIIINPVRIEVFNTLSALLWDPSVTRPKRLKVEFWNRRNAQDRARYGGLTVTMPDALHEQFKGFASHIKTAMLAQYFLPVQLGDPRTNIIETESTSITLKAGDTPFGTYQPDSSLAILDHRRPFLVVECAHTQSAKNVIRKARDYIYHAAVPIQFVVVIYIETAQPAKTAILTPNDTVSVSIYIPIFTPDAEVPVEMGTAIERLEVYPAATTETFTIKWSDVNCGSWEKYLAAHALSPNLPEPTCNVPMAALSDIAQRLAQPPADVSWDDVPSGPRRSGPRQVTPEPDIPSSESASLPTNDGRSFGSESYVPPSHDPSSDA